LREQVTTVRTCTIRSLSASALTCIVEFSAAFPPAGEMLGWLPVGRGDYRPGAIFAWPWGTPRSIIGDSNSVVRIRRRTGAPDRGQANPGPTCDVRMGPGFYAQTRSGTFALIPQSSEARRVPGICGGRVNSCRAGDRCAARLRAATGWDATQHNHTLTQIKMLHGINHVPSRILIFAMSVE
jgi:hypothetical protein